MSNYQQKGFFLHDEKVLRFYKSLAFILGQLSVCRYSNNTTSFSPLSDLSLQDSLFHEYKKVCSVCAVRIMPCGRTGRYAVIYFSTMADVDRAIEETRVNKYFMDWPVEVDVFLAGDELIDDK